MSVSKSTNGRDGSHRQRLDTLLVSRGLARSREEAKRLILAGLARVDGQRVDKAGTQVPVDCRCELQAKPHPYVSRGGVKLAAALEAFGVDPADRICLDVGASTGGFTHCLLLHGAKHVYAVDVGYGQLDQSLREDDRVTVRDRTNARYLKPETFDQPISLVTVDVSFISAAKLFASLIACVPKGDLIVLVKPQFEIGKGQVGRRGIVREPVKHAEVLQSFAAAAGQFPLFLRGLIPSPITGQKGNREFLAHLESGHRARGVTVVQRMIGSAVKAAQAAPA